jgi:acetyl-CoA carboxylase biotin carboxyl carrier protein
MSASRSRTSFRQWWGRSIAASPESPVFADVGKEVTEETVVCIIEAMKVMNEIKAEVKGVIAEVVADNGKPVQFGQVLFRVR